MWNISLRLLATLLAVVSLGLPAQAKKLRLPELPTEQPHMQLMHKQEPLRQRQLITPEEAVRRARGEYPGKVLSVRLRGGGEFYAVKIIKKGKVRVVNVPAER